MVIRTNLCLSELIIISILPTCLSYSFYRQLIPNGDAVPNPCPGNDVSIWRGVGHFLEEGGSARNLFGVDFMKFKKWTKEFCEKDSDEDGISSGEELGDPNCIWQPGTVSSYKARSHPGICEPIDTEYCRKKNVKFSLCTNSKCSKPGDSEVHEFTLRLPVLPVPAQKSSYTCMYYNLADYGINMEKTYHMIGNEVVVDNVNIIHHMIIYQCDETQSWNRSAFECRTGPKGCRNVLGGWNIGAGQVCLHKNAGFQMGKGGIKSIALQLHWSNSNKMTNQTDSSGIKFYYVTKPRKYNAVYMVISATNFNILPGISSCLVDANCPNLNNGSIYVTTAVSRMQYLGKEVRVEHRRHGRLIGIIGEDRNYLADSPKFYKMNKEIEVKSGDNLKLSCCYSSLNRTSPTRYGPLPSDEICFAFLLVYPYENFGRTPCGSGSYQECTVPNRRDFCSISVQTTPSKSSQHFNADQLYAALMIFALYSSIIV